MTDTYKGDSPAKKIMRFTYWSRVGEKLGLRTLQGKHLVLASREGGDISVLLGLGVNPKNIIPVEWDGSAADACEEKYASLGIKVIRDDIFEVAKRFHRDLVTMTLDFCCPASPVLLDRVVRAAAFGLRNDCVLGMNLLAGRERDGAREVLSEWRDSSTNFLKSFSGLPTEELREQLGKRLLSGKFNLSPAEIDYVKKMLVNDIDAVRDMINKTSGSFQTRFAYLGDEMLARGLDIGAVPVAWFYGYYISATESSKGVPMITFLGKMVRGSVGTHPKKLKKLVAREFKGGATSALELPPIGEEELRRQYFNIRDTGHPAPHLLLNIPEGRGRAWLAHRTMGTYAKTG